MTLPHVPEAEPPPHTPAATGQQHVAAAVELHREGRHTTSELAELFNVARSTVYRADPLIPPTTHRRGRLASLLSGSRSL
ncbi:helix-turn-helix domain-containing protein [Rhodococcus sp. NPDC059968]|uniref:helix-turn-helix domain-containing protein n=1 Tax=Rhodococcus sp. NPDC059968 TaxID=3347017 RepID=UPI0036701C75